MAKYLRSRLTLGQIQGNTEIPKGSDDKHGADKFHPHVLPDRRLSVAARFQAADGPQCAERDSDHEAIVAHHSPRLSRPKSRFARNADGRNLD